ncbi:MAG TPA: hydrogenase formation protein HypD [Kofleriaceae bacterium]|nr:hydrogenase formation protein HypD [Kofleriaceae bacterium]
MKHVDEFRDKALCQGLVARVASLVPQVQRKLGRAATAPIKIMEVCGGHTHAIFKYGLEGMLPETLELVHGPGCPVCVLPVGRVDDAISVAEQPGVIFATFGDALRVPGSERSLLQCKARGADIRVVYSPTDALALALAEPARQVVFFGLGFETTAPATALVVLDAHARGVPNFSVLSNHVTIMPTLQAILAAPELALDGFIGPGHVSMVIGTEPYEPVARDHHKPLVVAGFEPADVLQATVMVLEQLAAGKARVANQYQRVVRAAGNPRAQAVLAEVFEPRETFEWRGLGWIPWSGLRLRPAYAAFDAERRFAVANLSLPDHQACQCGEVLKGAIKPWQCKVFGTACTPDTPIGACMVSSEGSCAAYYNYGRLSTVRRLKERTEAAP